MSGPDQALECWQEIADEIRKARQVALFSDFDGTLVRIQRDPDRVALSAAVRRLLRAIAQAGVVVGIVSGRKVEEVRERVNLDHIWYVGAHGFFLLDPSNRSIALVSPKQRERIRAIGRMLTRRLRGSRGLLIENKNASIAVHYRAATSRSIQFARRVIGELVRENPELALLRGKRVWEFLPDSRTDKWTAISYILRRERRKSSAGRRLPIFLGDDATDERVFQKMKGISIAIGKKRRTAARYYLRSPAEVKKFLEKLKKEKE